jgi:hypothetical protein
MFKETRKLRHDFSESEVNEISQELVANINEKTRVEDEKKSAVRKFNGEIKYWDKKISRDAELITNGFEDRDTACEVQFNVPTYGNKTITRLDTKESWVEPMEFEEQDLFNQPKSDYPEIPEHDEENYAPFTVVKGEEE